MKNCLLIVALICSAFVFTAKAQDSFLLPEKFMLKKGDTLKVHLMQGNEFKEDYELKYATSATKHFVLNEGGKKSNLQTTAKDSAAPVVNFVVANQGLGLVEMVTAPEPIQMERESYAKLLSDQGLAKLADQVNNSNQSQFREKSTRCLKALVMIDKPTGGDFDKQTGQEYEIVLKKSPYKLNYGDDLTAVLYQKGKPVKAATVELFIRTKSGNIYPQTLSTDNDGQVNFTCSREGLYMLRAVKTEAANSNDYDFVTIQAAYVFRFSSQNEMPNDYHSFGLGEKH